jgi:prepilin-type N-terminal cleavage/methylation domain-containing protein
MKIWLRSLFSTWQKNTQRGFSLLELSISLMIIALVISSGLNLTTANVLRTQAEGTLDKLDDIKTALRVYLREYNRLPCPASITLAPTNALYGRSATDCADATPPAGLTRVEYPAASGRFVRIGGVPFYTLGLPARYGIDEYNNRIVYAVMESAITSLTIATTGNIRVLDNAGTVITSDVVLVLVSPGATHHGGYTGKTGALFSACNTTNKDGENCDNDGIFTDGVFNDSSVAASFFDDIIHWSRVPQLY